MAGSQSLSQGPTARERTRLRLNGSAANLRLAVNVTMIALVLGLTGGAVVANLGPLRDVAATATAPAAEDGPGPFAVGQLEKTGLGDLRVTEIAEFPGTAAPVQITLKLTNRGTAAVPFTASSFVLGNGDDGGQHLVRPVASSVTDRDIATGATLETTLTYVSDRAGGFYDLHVPGPDGTVEVWL
jgi:hypothetical protein